MANEEQLQRLKENVIEWNVWRQEHPDITIDLSGARLIFANLSGADLNKANLTGANINFAQLNKANLTGANLRWAKLEGSNLTGANLSRTRLLETCLINANLNGAALTDACLWETQRSGWSIRGIVCEAVYWDRNGHERTIYSPGEFERFYADQTKIVLYYEGGISPIEIATLPALIQRIESDKECVLRFRSIQEAPGGATVTLVVDDTGGRKLTGLEEALQEKANELQAVQRYALEQVDIRQGVERQLAQLQAVVFPFLLENHLKGRALQSPPQAHYLTTLFLDMSGFSLLKENQRSTHVNMLRGLAQPVLQQGAAKYINTWGDGIVACFEDANAGLRCACQLVTVLQAAGIQTRIGMSRGKTLVRGNPLTDRLDIEGDSVNFAARLEPLAELGEVLIAEELRYHPDIKQCFFVFTRQQRSLKKAVGDQEQGNEIGCYSVKLVEEIK